MRELERAGAAAVRDQYLERLLWLSEVVQAGGETREWGGAKPAPSALHDDRPFDKPMTTPAYGHIRRRPVRAHTAW